jgi:beta-galactosidase
MLVQSTTTPGSIKVTAKVLFNGLERPVNGELVINSIPEAQPAIYKSSELALVDKIVAGPVAEKGGGRSELAAENEKLRRELNSLKLKEVEKQQTTFGEGIN